MFDGLITNIIQVEHAYSHLLNHVIHYLLGSLGSIWLYLFIFVGTVTFSLFHPIGIDGLIYLMLFSLVQLNFEGRIKIILLLVIATLVNYLGCMCSIWIATRYHRFLMERHPKIYNRHKELFSTLTPIQRYYLGTVNRIYLCNCSLGFSIPFLFVWAAFHKIDYQEQARLFSIGFVFKLFVTLTVLVLCILYAGYPIVQQITFWIPMIASILMLYIFTISFLDSIRYIYQAFFIGAGISRDPF